MAESLLNTKTIRQAHASVEHIQIKQYQLATLLHRIYYKSKAQHRRAKWFQSLSGMRKNFGRLLDMQSVKSKIDESLPDRGVFAKGRSQRRGDGADAKEHGSFDAVERLIGKVWSSLWADNSSQDGSLIKYDTPPSNEADPMSSLSAANELLIICFQLQELANRSKISFNLLQIHLRTPPAPTFAPLVLSLLSLCAQIHSACLEALWTDGEKTFSMARLFGLFRSVGGTVTSQSSLELDGTSRRAKLAIKKTLNMIQSSSKSDLGWLPREIVQATPLKIPTNQSHTQQTEVDIETLPKLEPSTVLDDEEDLGVAV